MRCYNLKIAFISIVLLSSLEVFSQGNRLPDWSISEYAWVKTPFRWTMFSNKPFRIEKKLYLNHSDSTYRLVKQRFTSINSSFLRGFSFGSTVDYEFSGRYFLAVDTLKLYDKGNLLEELSAERKHFVSIEGDRELKLRYSHPIRFSISMHYALPILPYSINGEVFLRNKASFVGFNTSFFIHYLTVGGYFGLQKNSFISQIGMNHTSTIGGFNFFTISPKIGVVFKGVFLKVGSAILLDYKYVDSFKAINIELGYYFNFSNKNLFDLRG
jgi:hypothetical protein